MPDTSPRIDLTYLLPAQAQKHVTVNESLSRLDALVQLSVEAFDAETPPVSPANGEVWALGAAPTGVWAGQGGQIAQFLDGGWLFIAPGPGWRAWGVAESELRVFTGGTWTALGAGGTQNLAGVGIQTTSDATNRLSVAADATLLSHAGAGHQLKVNKAASGDTASLLFQSGFSGRAEMGLAGDDAFSVKVSGDGTTFVDAIRAEPAGLTLSLPVSGTGVQQSATDTTAGRLALAQHAYGPGNLLGTVSQAGGVPTGAVIEAGAGYVRFADGTQICRGTVTLSASAALTASAIWTYPAAFSAAPMVTVSLSLVSADWSTPTQRARVATTGTLAAPTTTQAQVGFYVNGATTITGTMANCAVMAIGRWF